MSSSPAAATSWATVLKPVEWFRPYPKNPRTHSEEALKQFAEAIKRFGFRIPVLARSTGDIVDGHFRFLAGKRLGLKELPVLLCDDMTPEDVRAFRISVNKMAELAKWDEDNLFTELEAVAAAGDPLTLDGPIGFELEQYDEPLDVKEWDFSLTADKTVITITSSKALEAEVRARLKDLGDDVTIEVSTLEASA